MARAKVSDVVALLAVAAGVAGYFYYKPRPVHWAKARWEGFGSHEAYDAKNYSLALARAEVAIAECPTYRGAYKLKGKAQRELNDHDGAIATFTKLIEMDDPPDADALGHRGGILAQFHQWDRAFADFDRAIALAPNEVWLRNQYGLALSEAERHADALAQYDKAVELDPTGPVIHGNRGRVLLRLKRDADARRAFDECLRRNPESANGYAGRAECELRAGNTDAGVADLATALRLDPDCTNALLTRCEYHLRRKDRAAAIQDLAHYVDLKPTDAHAKVQLLMLMIQ